MKIIFDCDSELSYDVNENINESTGKSEKHYKIKGIFSTIGEKNRNGRIYPRELWEKQVSDYQPNITNGSKNSLMEYEHPARTEVNQMEAVGKITKLAIDGNYVIGEAILLDNPKANQLKTLIDNGIKISVSSRGVGNVKNGVVEDFKLITYDIVENPSDFNATMNGLCESHILNEGVVEDLTFMIDESGKIVEVKDEPIKENEIETFDQKQVADALVQKFTDFLQELQKN